MQGNLAAALCEDIDMRFGNKLPAQVPSGAIRSTAETVSRRVGATIAEVATVLVEHLRSRGVKIVRY